MKIPTPSHYPPELPTASIWPVSSGHAGERSVLDMRAYDDVVAQHSGYRLSSFICAINQLVMDEPTKIPSPPKPAVAAEVPKNPRTI